ncbi:hypothetical protein LRR81_01665 [Metabacillus sp. GX 13764]|uniref:hypothetical protein n=1 Tax=Metabacillus kandeliae TaxID=2900151 RepID=UPI001E33089F|nr:hypothetical protein [Metabacillus kandeliae]MCD7032919.1 hypothetical protein [Metabacillus kandeliae]
MKINKRVAAINIILWGWAGAYAIFAFWGIDLFPLPKWTEALYKPLYPFFTGGE